MSTHYFLKAMEFIEYSKNSKDLGELSSKFQTTIKGFGFDHYACVSCVNFGTMPSGAVFLADYPEDWSNYYIENKFEANDRILEISLKQNVPFNWEDPVVHKGIKEPQIEILNDGADAGLLYGVTIPIHLVGAFPGAVNVVGQHKDVSPEAEHAIHLMSIYLHDAAMRIADESGQGGTITIKLTPREKECLKWVAAGKTDWEISSILSIAERTAHTHIEAAKKKLGVHTRVQAVVKAFLTNNIQF